MTSWLIRYIPFLLLVLPFAPVVADDLDDKEIARLVKQLGSTDFRMRDAATKRLEAIGKPTLDALRKAVPSNDVEARRRAEAIVSVIENKLYREHRLTPHGNSIVWTVSISADGKRLLTSSTDKTLRLWDTDTGKELRVFTGHTERIIGAALSPDGLRVLSGSGDKTVRLWDATTGKELRKMTGHASEVGSVAFGPDGKAISGGADRTMQLWDLHTGKNAGVFTGHTSVVNCVAYSDQAKRAATCSDDQSICVWDLETGKQVRKIPGQSGHNNNVLCFSPDGKRLLSAGVDLTLRILDVETGKELMRFKDADAYSAVFSPCGKRIVSGSLHDYNTVRVWDGESGKELHVYEGHTGNVTGVAFFPDGKRIASASGDGTARIWRAPR